MIARTMAIMGLLAFVVTIVGGLLNENSFDFILSRALWAMVLFSGMGLGVGWAAHYVVHEHQATQYREILGPLEDADAPADSDAENNSTSPKPRPIQN